MRTSKAYRDASPRRNNISELIMAFLATAFLAPFLALLSLYAGQKSYIAIANLQQYEERTEKAAKHLDKAAHDLYKTRVTQASGAAAVCILSSSPQVLYGSSLPSPCSEDAQSRGFKGFFFLLLQPFYVHDVMNVDHLYKLL